MSKTPKFQESAWYNKGAFDMAVLFINSLIEHDGSICKHLNKKQRLQFLKLLEKFVATNWNASKMIENQDAQGRFNFEFLYDDEHNIKEIRMTVL